MRCCNSLQTNRTLAIKKIRLGKYKEGVNVTALREIKLLKELHDPNIIELVDVYPHKRNLHLVFEFMESDLEAVIRDRNIFLSPADCKSYMQMALNGLAVCHKKWILHRLVCYQSSGPTPMLHCKPCHCEKHVSISPPRFLESMLPGIKFS